MSVISDSIISEFMKYSLHLCHITVLLPVAFLMLATKYRKLIVNATLLLFFVMIFNTYLKQLFKVPLLPHLGNGYAFPSGHMHASGIFYGYLLLKVNNKVIKGILLMVIFSVASSLVYHNFHGWYEIFGAWLFASCEIAIYYFLQRKYSSNLLNAFILLVAFIFTIILFFTYKIQFHIWIAWAGLIVCALLSVFFNKYK